MKSFSGVSILGNGQVALIIDVAGIIKKAGLKIREISKEATEEEQALARDAEVQTLLVFDNQTPERFAFPLELISRIEQVPVSRIERIKDRQFIQYHEKKLRLIFLEDYLPVSRPDRTQNETIGVIIPKQVKHPMGIVINEVINTVEAAVALDTETIMAKGLFGSAVLEEKITLLPDMYRLFEMAAPEHYDKTDSQLKKNNQKYRILLVDDTPFFRMVEKDYLTSAGYEVLMAEDGKQALRLLEEESVDAVVLDIVMPKMDGWEVIRQIRSDDRLKNLPVMAVTSLGAESGKDMSREGFRVGFDQWELKLNKTSLLEKLGAMLH
jgi:two-component system chemotaxis sensor kinase CheA